MSNEVIIQSPSIERAKELEKQAKEGLNQMKKGQDMAILACHKMRDTKAYTILGFDTYYAWGESTLNLKKSRLNELALAGEVQQELLNGVENNVIKPETTDVNESHEDIEMAMATETASNNSAELEVDNETINTKELAEVSVTTASKPITSASDLSEMGTPQLLALAKAPKGKRLTILDKVVVESKAEEKSITTTTIKEAVKASAEPVEELELSEQEQAVAIKKQHKSAMGKVSKLSEALNELDTTIVDIEELENWKIYLEEIKLSISNLEKQLGYE